MMTLDTIYRLYCTMDYDIILRYFFPLYKHDKIQIFLPKSLTPYPVTIEQRFVIIITPFVTLHIRYLLQLRYKGTPYS